MKYKYLFLFLLLAITNYVHAQLTVTTGLTATNLVQNVLVGEGVTISNITYQGSTSSIGRFQTGSVPTNLGLSSGVILSSGIVNNTIGGSATSNFLSSDLLYPAYSLLTNIAGYTTYDAAVLQFNFIPESDTIRFRYVFASEEYNEFVASSFNDVFGFFITGPNPLGPAYNNKNIALIPNSTTPVTINNVNNGNSSDCSYGPCTNCQFFVDNCTGTKISYDAFTKVLTAQAVVVPCQTYTIILAVADAMDGVYDSAVFLEANSFSTNAVQVSSTTANPTLGTNAIEGCNNGIINFCLPQPTPINRTVFYTVSGTATNGVDYQTIPNSIVIPAGQSCAQLSIIPTSDGITEGAETIVLTVQTSSCAQDVITLNIQDYSPMDVTNSGNTSVCAGNTTPVQICTSVTGGSPPYTYNWSNGLPSASCNNVNPAQTTTYSVTVSDACGYTALSNITVGVTQNANITVTPNNPSICFGTGTDLTANGGISYTWNNSLQSSTITVSPTQTTTYSVSGTDATGCTGSTSVTVTVNSNPTVTATASPPAICLGFSSTLNAQGASTYLWSTNTANSTETVSPTQSTDYTVTGTDSNGCTGSANVNVTVNNNPVISITPSAQQICQGQSVTLTGNGGTQYNWSSGTPGTSVTLTPDQTTTYTVTGTDNNGCSGTASVDITVNPNPIVTATISESEICINTPVTLTATGSDTYVWSNNNTNDTFTDIPTQSTTYTVTGTNQTGCSGTASVSVTVFFNLTVAITPSNPNICFGDSITISANSNGTNPVFVWDTGDTLQSLTLTPPATTDYLVNVQDQYGCTGSATTTVTVSPIPEVDFSGTPLLGCSPLAVSFTGISATENSFQWVFGDNTTSTQANPQHLYTYAGTFTVTLNVTSPYSCKNSITKPGYVTVHPLPVAAFTPFPSVTTEDEPTISFLDESIGATSWLWNFDDGDIPASSIEQNPAYTYINLGKHYVSLNVENQWGCSDSTEKVVYVKPITTFFIPNSFSPNDDTFNDIFLPYGYNVDSENYLFVIYDRWGKKVFSTTNLSEGWDGYIQGTSKIAPIGVYTYIINASFTNIKRTYTGTLTLFY